MKFPESKLAHFLLDDLNGIEIGASAHNPFNIPNCVYVDYSDDMSTIYKKYEIELCGEAKKVDIVAFAEDLPFDDNSLQYVLTSHVIEHCWDVIGTIEEWFRILENGGLIFMVIPHKERTFDRDRDRTPFSELVYRNKNPEANPISAPNDHYSVWITEDWLEICEKMGWALLQTHDVDDKVGNGFTVVLKK